MKIVFAGGSGFIGKKLKDFLTSSGHEVIILTRKYINQNDRGVSYVQWLVDGSSPEKELGGADAIVNLAGVSINDGRWTAKHQEQIYESRMTATEELIRIIKALEKKPSVLINASAIGIYPGTRQSRYQKMKQYL
jgi:NAD dependent epimerase/dehydratase family enzyme